MNNKKNTGLLLAGIILGLCTITAFEPVYSKNSARTEQEITEPEVNQQIEPAKDEETPVEDIKVNRDTLDKASELMEQKDFAGALPYLNAYIEAKPKKYQGYKLRGEAYYALRRYNEAVKDFQQAVDIKTADDKFATGTKVISAVVLGADKQEQYQNPELGILYGELMYAQKAVNDNMYEVSYKKAMEYNSHQYLPEPKKSEISKINCPQKYGKVFNPQGIDADIALVIDDIAKGKFTEAVYTVPKITSQYPDYYLGHYLTGVIMSGLEQKEQAVSEFERAIALNPYDFESYASLGLLYYREAEKTFDSTNSDKSVSYFEKAISMNSNCNTYYYYIGLNQMIEGEYAKAVENFKKAIQLKNNDYNSRYYMAVAQYLNGDYNGTIDEATNLIYRRVSNLNSVLYLRALAYYKLRDYNSSIADIEKIHHNMDDIYNADVKNLTAKEQTLECYLYYLQSKIARDNGGGAKSDLAKAYQNPVIALLDKRSKDFGQVNYKLTSFDVDSQYDYLRTTFDDYGVGFEYLNPDYKIVQKSVQTAQVQEPEKTAQNQDLAPDSDEIIAPSQKLVLPVNSEPAKELASEAVSDKLSGKDLTVNNENIGSSKSDALQKIAEAQKQEETLLEQDMRSTKKAENVPADEFKPEDIQSGGIIPDVLADAKEEAVTSKTGAEAELEKIASADKEVKEIKAKEQIIDDTAKSAVQEVKNAAQGAGVEVEEIPAAEKHIHLEPQKSAQDSINQQVPDEVELPQDSLKQKITEKYGEKVISTPPKTDFNPLQKSKPVMVFDPDTLIFAQPDESEASENALTPDNSAKIKTLLDKDSHVTNILESPAVAVQDKNTTVQTTDKPSELRPAADIPEVEEKLTEIKEKTSKEDVKPVIEITENERTQEISEPAVPEAKSEAGKEIPAKNTNFTQLVNNQNAEVKTSDVPEANESKQMVIKDENSVSPSPVQPAKAELLPQDIEKPVNVEISQADTDDNVDSKTEKHGLQNLLKNKKTNDTVSEAEDLPQEAPSVRNYVVDVSQNSKSLKVPVNEKYADVNPADFNVTKKTKPDIKDGDEIIFLDTASDDFMQRAKKQMNDNYEQIITSPKKDTTAEQNIKTEQTEEIPAAEKSHEDTNPQKVKEADINITKETLPQDKPAEVQEVVVPTVKTPEKSVSDISKPDIQKQEASDAVSTESGENPPELRGVDEASPAEDITDNTSIKQDTVKLKKKKKAKVIQPEDNVVIAAGGYPENYLEEENTVPVKEKKQKKTKKTKTSVKKDVAAAEAVTEAPAETVSEEATEASPAESSKQETKQPEVSDVENKTSDEIAADTPAEISTETNSDNAKKKIKKKKTKEVAAEQDKTEAKNTVSDAGSVEQYNKEGNSDNNEIKEEKPKKQSFFKRLFSWKRKNAGNPETAPVPDTTEAVQEEKLTEPAGNKTSEQSAVPETSEQPQSDGEIKNKE